MTSPGRALAGLRRQRRDTGAAQHSLNDCLELASIAERMVFDLTDLAESWPLTRLPKLRERYSRQQQRVAEKCVRV